LTSLEMRPHCLGKRSRRHPEEGCLTAAALLFTFYFFWYGFCQKLRDFNHLEAAEKLAVFGLFTLQAVAGRL